jgi:hypothetical protein
LAGEWDVDNMPANPSLLGRYGREEPSVFAGFMDHMGGLKGGAIGYGDRGGERWGYGAYLTYLTSGSIPLATWEDPVGGSGEDFAYTELGGGVACGVEIVRSLVVGAAGRALREAIDDDASTAAWFDIGATVTLAGFGGRGANAVHLCVLGRCLAGGAWNTRSEPPAPSLETGLAVGFLGGRASAGCSFAAGEDGRRQAIVGLSGMMSDGFEARIGYKRNVGKFSDASYDLPAQRGLVSGFSVLLGRSWIDYTYEDASPMDNVHRLGLRVHPGPAAEGQGRR